HYVEVVKAANADYRQGGNGSIKALSLFDREHDNVNAGFEWSVARSNSSKEAASICSDYARYASQILQLRKPPKTRIRWYSQALDAARYVEDVEAELVHLIGLGGAYRKLGERETALDIYMNAREIAAKSSFPQLKAEILSSLGLEYRDRGEIHKARECFDEQLTISRELGNSRGVSLALVNLGNASLALGRVDEAIKRYEEAIDISRKIADLQAEGLALGNLGRAYIQIKDSDRALEFCRQHLEISRKLGDRLGEATALFNIALASQQKGAVDEARAEAGAALEIYEQLESANAERVRKWLAQLEPQLVTHDRGNETT
ncbi:MAG TPA: tetratricopeptide repeat protein, partial [Pyrinomonadaceae bacterium]